MSDLKAYVKQLLKDDPLFQTGGNGDSIGKRVAYNVKRIRKIKGFTQLELANEMGVKQPFIARIESGKNNISIKKLEQLAQVFKMDPMVLLRPIFEEGTPREVGRLVVDKDSVIYAANIGMELYLKEKSEFLIGTPLKKGDPISDCLSKAYETASDIVNYPSVYRENGMVEKKMISVFLVRNDENEVMGAEVFCRTYF